LSKGPTVFAISWQGQSETKASTETIKLISVAWASVTFFLSVGNVAITHIQRPRIANMLCYFWDQQDPHVFSDLSDLKPLPHLLKRFPLKFDRDTTCALDGQWEVALLSKDDSARVTVNVKLAEQRYRWWLQRLERDNDLQIQYEAKMEDLRSQGKLSKCQNEHKNRQLDTKLPHHVVVCQEATSTQCGIEFDSSAHGADGKLLMDTLELAPVVQAGLVKILLKFRNQKHVLGADIAKMFRQISVRKKDRVFQGIL
jgi:hypothetical protein